MTTAPARTTHERVVAAAAELTLDVGWAGVTMGKLAHRVGVSRQTVYNEVGSKPQLAEEMVLAELAKFLAVVDAAFDEQPTDLVEAIRAASRGVLELARSNALLQAVVSASYGAETELLPLLTTRNDALVLAASQVVQRRVAAYRVDIDDRHLGAAIDMVVRLVLSHVVHPIGEPADTADDIAWISSRALQPSGRP
ncbi:MAG TPA: TetR family transcriptional regulator [Nocardioides sp.]|uniref:TetR/AcrR family transcriptional regulator n=1 Tax=Nocardioides sp. TaxID=35761 RepID=UPI002F41BE4A